MMSMLCNCYVRELLILARTWFAFGLPSKTGCDTGAPPDSPEAPPVRAPTVEPQRLADVAGAPNCPVRHATTVSQRPFLVVVAINTLTTPHSRASKFLHFYTLQEL
jgi:hypothetical protein